MSVRELAHTIQSEPDPEDEHFEDTIMQADHRRGMNVGGLGEAGLFQEFDNNTRKLLDQIGLYE